MADRGAEEEKAEKAARKEARRARHRKVVRSWPWPGIVTRSIPDPGKAS